MHTDALAALERQLIEAQTRFATAKAELERLRDEMARAKCPFSVGDEVLLTKGGKNYSGIVASIAATPIWLDNSTDPPIDWIAQGRRINTTTGQAGKWTFEIVGDQSTQERGRWRHNTLNEALGLSDEED